MCKRFSNGGIETDLNRREPDCAPQGKLADEYARILPAAQLRNPPGYCSAAITDSKLNPVPAGWLRILLRTSCPAPLFLFDYHPYFLFYLQLID